MPADQPPPRDPLPPLIWPEGKPPVSQAADGGWKMEFAPAANGEFNVRIERVGGLVRILGNAIVRRPGGNIIEPMTVVIREEDARNLWPALVRELGAH